MSHIGLLIFWLSNDLQKLVCASSMSKNVTFKIGHFPAFKNVHSKRNYELIAAVSDLQILDLSNS